MTTSSMSLSVPATTARSEGVGVLRRVLAPDDVSAARRIVLEHRHLLRNTRPTPSAGHLAGFHRFPQLEPLHTMISQQPSVLACVAELCGPGARTIGMSDITVNRSQPWHKDLLRGRYRRHLRAAKPCARWHGTVFKFLVYLQDSASLQVVVGSQLEDLDLSSNEHAVPTFAQDVRVVAAEAGDVVVLDVCTTHRGSDEAAFASTGADARPKILVSTVFGAATSELTDRLELGNAVRLADWMLRHE